MFSEEFQAVCNAAKNKLNLLETNPLGYFTSSFLAGMYIALGSILMGFVGSYFAGAGSCATKLISGIVFSVGLSFVVMAGADLFTGNNLYMACAALKKEVTWGSAAKLWIVCYLGNLVGSIVGSVIFTLTGIPTGDTGAYFGNLAATKMSGTPVQLFAKAILCNICVCIVIWCAAKLKTEAAKIMMIFCGVTTFVTCGFEHSIANMTFLTVGLLNPNGAAVTIAGYFYNLIIVTLGNMVGGILFVAVPYYLISKKSSK
jgi:nitrite transporter NirC